MQEVDSPINVCLTGAAGQIAYALLPYLLNGSIFGAHVCIHPSGRAWGDCADSR